MQKTGALAPVDAVAKLVLMFLTKDTDHSTLNESMKVQDYLTWSS